MDANQKNDSIILKGTNFKSKPLFSPFKYHKFDDLINHLMVKYGDTITNGQPIKGKENIYWKNMDSVKSKSVPIPLQPYRLPFYYSMLLVVGSDDSDTLVLTSPIEEKVRKFFGYSRWSCKPEYYGDMLRIIEKTASFVPLTYNCTTLKLPKDWHKEVHLREWHTVTLYVVPQPMEYVPMLFINCSMDNVRSLYKNITALMSHTDDPLLYSPYRFASAIFRPIMFNAVNDRLEHRRRLPGIDVTEDEFNRRRQELLRTSFRNMVSDCKCRLNDALLPSDHLNWECPWDLVERVIYNTFHITFGIPDLPQYTLEHGKCGKCEEHVNAKDTEEPL